MFSKSNLRSLSITEQGSDKARAAIQSRPRRHGSPACGHLPRRVSPQAPKSTRSTASPHVAAATKEMAAPSSSLASSSHLSRHATAAPSHSSPQQLRLGCFSRRGAQTQQQRVRCRWAGRVAPRRRAPGVCFVVSPSQPGLAAIDVPAATIPNDTTTSVPERTSVSSLLEVVSDDLLKLNNNLKSLIGAENPVLVSAAEQIFGAGGKRLRPALVFLVSRATSGLAGLSELTAEHQRLAEIIEMIHTASLIHDDVIDDSGMRRGKETIHQLYGTRVAVLAGDFMFAQSSWFLANLENIEVIKLISQVIKDFASGEIKQASTLFDCDVTLDDYLLKSYYKTASLIAASTRSAAIFSGVSTTICEQMYEYGRNLGLSFQVVDDILDFTQSAEQLGKPAGSDLAKGNLTAPVIFALQDEPQLREIIDSEFSETDSLAAAIELVHRSDGIRRAHELAREKGELAIQNLQCLPRSDFRSTLEKMVKYNLERIE
ncbi:probable solanesyl-diphosphate synthase 3, chloroplastic [Phragmites australis]|uniref:probable solanesyl-diphosphate synthase 3, chloroplastic n=1 Tax=Phragmites australis TaxID=29695 RepID=UPI002D7752D4|nr:probable solanesyl-diphosphate synthase 3, chloroplastic [Phragmites australis]